MSSIEKATLKKRNKYVPFGGIPPQFLQIIFKEIINKPREIVELFVNLPNVLNELYL